MPLDSIDPEDLEWTARPHEDGEPARHVAELSEIAGSPRAGRLGARVTAAQRAAELVEEVRDDAHGRFELCARIYEQQIESARRHRHYRRAALSFMRWQVKRGVLEPMHAEVPGSPWWRAVNERLLSDGCEAAARSRGLDGTPTSPTIELWMEFIARPTARSWYRAHNASIVAAYIQQDALAAEESQAERFFMNVVLLRVLYAHALVAAPRLSLGRFAALSRPLGDPRLGMAGAFLSLSRILPDRYPSTDGVQRYVEDENNVGRMLDYGVILPRVQELYEWSSRDLSQPALAELVSEGAPCYAAPFGSDAVWRLEEPSLPVRVLERATRP